MSMMTMTRRMTRRMTNRRRSKRRSTNDTKLLVVL
jgi:hypothetical protein